MTSLFTVDRLNLGNTILAGTTTGTFGSSGTRLVLSTGTTTTTPYALGMNTNAMWYGVPSGASHVFYGGNGGTNELVKIDQSGFLGICTTGTISVNSGFGRAKSYGSCHDANKQDAFFTGRWDGTNGAVGSSFASNVLSTSQFNGIGYHILSGATTGVAELDNQAQIRFYTWGNNIADSREVMRLDSRGRLSMWRNTIAESGGVFPLNGILVSARADTNDSKNFINKHCDFLSGQVFDKYIFWYWNWNGQKFVYQSPAGTTPYFTGQHKSYSDTIPFNKVSELQGLIVISTGKSRTITKTSKLTEKLIIQENDVNNAHPVVSLSSQPYQKSVHGVITNYNDDSPNINTSTGEIELDDDPSNGFYDDRLGRIRINSVGEGSIWVTDENGPIETGDYITTSSLMGYGMKQNDDLLHNYTVAKSTVNCDFIRKQVQKKKLNHIVHVDENNTKTIEILSDMKGCVMTQPVMISDLRELNPDEVDDFVYEDLYQMRWFFNGIQITEEEYTTLSQDTTNLPNLRRACFIGCTYHCG